MVWQQVANLPGEISCGGSIPLTTASMEGARLDEEPVLKTGSGTHSVVGSSPTPSSLRARSSTESERDPPKVEAASSNLAGFIASGAGKRPA